MNQLLFIESKREEEERDSSLVEKIKQPNRAYMLRALTREIKSMFKKFRWWQSNLFWLKKLSDFNLLLMVISMNSWMIGQDLVPSQFKQFPHCFKILAWTRLKTKFQINWVQGRMHHRLIHQRDQEWENKWAVSQLQKAYEFQERREEKFSDWIAAAKFKKDDA